MTFENGIEGVVDIAQLVDFTCVFEPLQSEAYFLQVTVNSDIGTIC